MTCCPFRVCCFVRSREVLLTRRLLAANDFQLRPGLVIGAIQTVRARKHIQVTKKVESHFKLFVKMVGNITSLTAYNTIVSRTTVYSIILLETCSACYISHSSCRSCSQASKATLRGSSATSIWTKKKLSCIIP
jgi:hypothetical protein